MTDSVALDLPALAEFGIDAPSHARGVVSHREIENAYHRALGLQAESPATALRHGDFLDKNILLDEAGRWWAIDPRPCLGDPWLDPARVSAWMRVFAVSEAVLARDAELSVAYAAVLRERTSRFTR